MMREKRKFSRWQTKKETYFKPRESSQGNTLLDISPGGMRIVLDNKVVVGSHISGEFRITEGQGPFYIRGEIVWVKPAVDQANRACYIVGIKFKRIRTKPI
jgi:c-di-GMP-binding flagellar brake protein YcgR